MKVEDSKMKREVHFMMKEQIFGDHSLKISFMMQKNLWIQIISFQILLALHYTVSLVQYTKINFSIILV